jgi:hypothetical protein
MNEGKIAKAVAEKLWNGDRIDDDELLVACTYYKDVGNRLVPLGDVFKLAANEALRLSDRFHDYARARKLV